ncbi:hypothetical protein EJ05DRAFT_226272 [Pseudovirgaria hyperparasitica]|uniref:BZIP transcription factor n=1 Tax=Pseudovirgaria hyperparasitica TaxID=470096 RepID=A0A6A6VTK8_9PEZI|nr:uncharacterized protein EJ05DRAFT_226272 [Pseudovirgaria hyperparasitica]KAF2753126.1 hypothetical protein EJ05DRAFT_226272 [Pseudovirgaria hyperparasitica]
MSSQPQPQPAAITSPILTVTEHTADGPSHSDMEDHHSSASSSASDDCSDGSRLQRPKLGSRKSSGTIIIPRDSPHVELKDEDYDETDARTMSPRRSSEEIDRLGEGAKDALLEQSKQLQASLLEIVERVESVRAEHEKLEGGNRFLQSYIGELMQTSKLIAAGASKMKGKAKSRG